MSYEVRSVSPEDPTSYRCDRWVIHESGKPAAVVGYAFTKGGAKRTARRWVKQHERACRSCST